MITTKLARFALAAIAAAAIAVGAGAAHTVVDSTAHTTTGSSVGMLADGGTTTDPGPNSNPWE